MTLFKIEVPKGVLCFIVVTNCALFVLGKVHAPGGVNESYGRRADKSLKHAEHCVSSFLVPHVLQVE